MKATVTMFSPDEFIDRVDEQRMFKTLVAREDDARLLTIRDDSGRGKSHLLKQLRHICRSQDPPVPVSLITLDELQPKTAHNFVKHVEKTLEAFQLPFDRYRELERSRLLGKVGMAVAGAVTAQTIGGQANVTGIKVEGDLNYQGGETDPELQDLLRREAVGGFIADLRNITAASPVVLLVDAYEQCGGELEQWIPDFVQGHLLDPENRCENLILVIAGQKVPNALFSDLMGQRFERLVRAVPELSVWEREHVETYLTQRSIQYYEEDVDFICAKLRKGFPIGDLANWVSAFAQRMGA